MTAKHTAGPWTVEKGAIKYHISANGNEGVAQTSGLHYDNEANARLIAAAPELLECIEDVEANLAGRDNFPERVADSLRRLRAALAKAKGA